VLEDEPGGQRRRQQRTDVTLAPDQQHLGAAAGGLDGTRHDLGRGTVAAHGVDGHDRRRGRLGRLDGDGDRRRRGRHGLLPVGGGGVGSGGA
jgi:hypothetical protein